ncbi:hypothetical protein Tco_1400167 [Tanacetum coccineum]
MSSSTVTYTSVSSDSEPWRFQWAPPSPDYVPGPEHPPSRDYVPGPEYPEYVASSDDEIPVEDQPLPADASPTALSPGYVVDSDLEEDPEEDPADYLSKGGDDDEEEEESSEDDDEEEEEEVSEEDEDEEDEHLASDDSIAATPPPLPRSPRTKVPFSQTRLRRARKTIRLQPPMAASTKALIAEFSSAPTPPSPPPSLLSPWSSPLPRIPFPPIHTSPTYTDAPLGYKAVMVQLRAASPLPIPSLPLHVPSSPLLLPSADRKSDIPETVMPFRKRLCLTAPDSRFEVGESSTAAAARQTGHTLARRVDYGFVDTIDASIRAFESRGMTAVEEVNERVTELATTQRQDSYELHVRDEDA